MSKKDLNFEIDLLPVISLLAVLICFLLLTTAWVHIGSVEIAQGLGGQSAQTETKKAEIQIWLNKGKVKFQLKNVKKQFRSLGSKKPMSLKQAKSRFSKIKKKVDHLNMAFITPSASSDYESIITLIDHLKNENINEVGVNPL